MVIRLTGAGRAETDIRIEGATLALNRRNSGKVDFHEKFPAIHTAPIRRKGDGSIAVRLLIDTSSVEVFANGGETVISNLIFPREGDCTVSLVTVGDIAPPVIRSIRLSVLKSAW